MTFTKTVPKLSLAMFILKNAVQRQIFLAYPILFKKQLQYVDSVVSDCTVWEGKLSDLVKLCVCTVA